MNKRKYKYVQKLENKIDENNIVLKSLSWEEKVKKRNKMIEN